VNEYDVMVLKAHIEKLEDRRKAIDDEVAALAKRLEAIEKATTALERSKAGVYGGKL
jgi:prefoldin subunit 5